MVVTFDDTAAAYGLFQVVFSDIADHLGIAVFRLRERKEPGLVFEEVFKQRFSENLKQFRKELDQFEKRSVAADYLHDVREACKIISKLIPWTNSVFFGA